jgi:hypothetical protein
MIYEPFCSFNFDSIASSLLYNIFVSKKVNLFNSGSNTGKSDVFKLSILSLYKYALDILLSESKEEIELLLSLNLLIISPALAVSNSGYDTVEQATVTKQIIINDDFDKPDHITG